MYYGLVVFSSLDCSFKCRLCEFILPAALMYVLVPMPCLFFGGGSTQFLTSRDGGGLVLLNLSPLNI